jgi:hypothetical protein
MQKHLGAQFCLGGTPRQEGFHEVPPLVMIAPIVSVQIVWSKESQCIDHPQCLLMFQFPQLLVLHLVWEALVPASNCLSGKHFYVVLMKYIF